MMATTTILQEKRFRPSPALRRFTYSALVARDGEKCQVCEAGPPLEIDHKDRKKETWTIQNLRLLCKPCNVSLQNRPATSVNERKRGQSWIGEGISYEASRSLELGPSFEAELDRLLVESEGLTVRSAEDRLAKLCGCDQQTVDRWIRRETTPEGKYSLSERTVRDKRGLRTLQIIGRKEPERGGSGPALESHPESQVQGMQDSNRAG